MITLEQLIAGMNPKRSSGRGAVQVSQIEYDSRRVSPGTLFVAMKGAATDGNRYIPQAIMRGAVAIVTDSELSFDSVLKGDPQFPVLEVQHGRRALAELCRTFYGYPDQKLGLTGVTGTNGKTTTAYLLEQLLRQEKRKTILVGTIEYRIGDRVFAAPHTTPESRDLLELFSEGVAEGATEAVMEVSSHALDQGRVWQLAFDVAIFTNLTRDHLDYHGTLENYLRAKQRLFDGSSSQVPKTAIINIDDAAGPPLIAASKAAGAQVLTYGIASGDFHATMIEMSPAGTSFMMQTPAGDVLLKSRLLGRINIYNLLAAASAAHARGVSLEQIGSAAETLHAPPGRFESIGQGQGFTVVVDYAHTDDALRNVTRLAREIVEPHHGRVITMFGCGGDRDTTKRPLMGKAAGEGSEVVVVTSDNPRTEEPGAIIEQILPGLRDTTARVVVEPDRAVAIELALNEARAGDIVLIAGKGHEKTQTIGSQLLPFDDAVVARSRLEQMANRGDR
jgi:UDP-N-acetylmuramoyl-L-alanyl-D-glutamate--2,6-diaminopimelate ligase